MTKAAQQRAQNKKLNKSFAKKKTSKEETVIQDDTLDSNYSSRSEDDNPLEEDNKTSIAYDSYYADDEKISSRSIGSEEYISLNGCRDGFIIDKLKLNGK